MSLTFENQEIFNNQEIFDNEIYIGQAAGVHCGRPGCDVIYCDGIECGQAWEDGDGDFAMDPALMNDDAMMPILVALPPLEAPDTM